MKATREEIFRLLESHGEEEVGLTLLSESDFPDAAEIARRYLGSHDAFVRRASIEVITNRGTYFDLPYVVALLADETDIVRVEALECLARIGSVADSVKAVPLLSDPEPLVRAYAGWAIAQLGDTQGLPHVVEALAREAADVAKAGLLEAKIRLSEPPSAADMEKLTSLLLSPDHQAREFSANSLVGVATAANRSSIREAISSALRGESAVGVQEAFRSALSALQPRKP